MFFFSRTEMIGYLHRKRSPTLSSLRLIGNYFSTDWHSMRKGNRLVTYWLNCHMLSSSIGALQQWDGQIGYFPRPIYVRIDSLLFCPVSDQKRLLRIHCNPISMKFHYPLLLILLVDFWMLFSLLGNYSWWPVCFLTPKHQAQMWYPFRSIKCMLMIFYYTYWGFSIKLGLLNVFPTLCPEPP